MEGFQGYSDYEAHQYVPEFRKDGTRTDRPPTPNRCEWYNRTPPSHWVKQYVTPTIDFFDVVMGPRSLPCTRKLYNAIISKRYSKEFAMHKYHGPSIMTDVISKRLQIPREAPIIDMGAGTGYLGEMLAQIGYTNMEGNDISENMLYQATMTNCYVYTQNEKVADDADLEYNCHGPGYECVVFLASLMPSHIKPSALENVCAKLLAHGGYVVILGPTLERMKDFDPEFAEENFQAVLLRLQTTQGITLLERSVIEVFFNNKPGELFILQKGTRL